MTSEPLAARTDENGEGGSSGLWTVTVVLAFLGIIHGLAVLYFSAVVVSDSPLWLVLAVVYGAMSLTTIILGWRSRGRRRRWPQIVTGALAAVTLILLIAGPDRGRLTPWTFWGLMFSDEYQEPLNLQVRFVWFPLMALVQVAWVVVAIIWATRARPSVAPSGVASLPVVAADGGVAPGWYVDPDGKPSERFWDGDTWTDQTRPLTTATAAVRGPHGVAGTRTNVLAIVALVLAFVFPLAGLVLGYVALSQIKRSGEGGRGLALAAVILGWVFTLLVLAWIVLVLVAASGSSSY